jgi:hypothetical protein
MTTVDPASEPTVRWTEHGPEPAPAEPAPAEPARAEPAVAEDLASLKARLAARGLLRDQPSINIREVAGDAPGRVVAFEPEPIFTTGRQIVDDDLGDPEELEPEQPGPTTKLRCPGCRTPQEVHDNATGYRCTSCAKVWRWATCSGCHALNLTIARQESWRCNGCGAYTRSWWRTPTRAAEHRRVAEARVTDAAERRRREAYEKARRRRWKLLSAGAAAIIATSIATISFARGAEPVVDRGATGQVCDAFGEIQNDISGGAPLATIRASIDALAADSVDAIDRVRIPAQELAGAGQPGDKPFDDAAAKLGRACAG